MTLNKTQAERAQQIWNDYVVNGIRFVEANEEFSDPELDERRRKTIPEVTAWLQRLLSNEVSLEEFKTAIDGINKRNRLWGFRAINGQMFFNVMTKNSLIGDRMTDLKNILKRVLPVPGTLTEAQKNIEDFAIFIRELAKYSQDLRGAPKVGSIPFFLSYFWQIQASEKFPVYYTSMVSALNDTGIWSPKGNVAEDYISFYELNQELLSILSSYAGKTLHLWDVEHAFWYCGQSQVQPPVESTKKTPQPSEKEVSPAKDLPDSYIPPVVSILPMLAYNDEELRKLCQKSGKSIEKVFEERLAILFRMLGYETELLGQGHGRVPDGVAISQEFRYAIIYDAKVRQQPYTMGTDERAIREYINDQGEKLRRRGMRNLYFMVISSAFTGDHDDAIRSLKIDTDVNEVLLVEVKSLLALLEGKLRNPDVSLGPVGIQRLLVTSGLLTESDVREFLEI